MIKKDLYVLILFIFSLPQLIKYSQLLKMWKNINDTDHIFTEFKENKIAYFKKYYLPLNNRTYFLFKEVDSNILDAPLKTFSILTWSFSAFAFIAIALFTSLVISNYNSQLESKKRALVNFENESFITKAFQNFKDIDSIHELIDYFTSKISKISWLEVNSSQVVFRKKENFTSQNIALEDFLKAVEKTTPIQLAKEKVIFTDNCPLYDQPCFVLPLFLKEEIL